MPNVLLRHGSPLTAILLLAAFSAGCSTASTEEASEVSEDGLTRQHDLVMLTELRSELVSKDGFEPWFVCRAGTGERSLRFVIAGDLRVAVRFQKYDYNGAPVDAEVAIGKAKLVNTALSPRIFEIALAGQKLVLSTSGPTNIARLVRGNAATTLKCEEFDAPYGP